MIENLQIIDTFDINSPKSDKFKKLKNMINDNICLTDEDKSKNIDIEDKNIENKLKTVKNNEEINPKLITKKKNLKRTASFEKS